MSDPLRDKILERLGTLTDREKFEACAVDLLGKQFPGLVALPGGSDGGFDGVELGKNGEILQLVCTTGQDVLGNLSGSLLQAQKMGLKSDAVIVATTQPLTPPQKRKLAHCAQEFGRTLYPVCDRVQIANLLYHDSHWRKSLLGIPGHPPALSLLPANHRPTFDLVPLGREEEQAKLLSVVGDLVVVGQPGSGKTHLLAHMAAEANGLFLVSDNPAAIADGLRDQSPDWVIVDDAHSRLDGIVNLRQLRRDIDADFRIVATCWPGQEPEVSAKLGIIGQQALVLDPLPMQVIKQIVAALDISGPDQLLREILHQSNGKPGLAVTLCQICWRHGSGELFTGEALTRDVKISLAALAGEDAVRLLGYFALAGDAGLTVEEAAQLAGMSALMTAGMAEKMGAAGVLEVGRNHRLMVEPARLRQALVRDIFCLGAAKLDWRPLLAAMPNRAESVDTVIAAGLLGGEVDDPVLRQEVAALNLHGASKLIDHYARLGPQQSRWVFQEYPAQVGEAAEPLLAHLPEETDHLLLLQDLAKTHRPRQERDELPELRKWINARAHQVEGVLLRKQLLGVIESIREDLQDTPTLFAAIGIILACEFEWTDQPPGEAASLRIQHGFVPVGALEQIAALWPRILPLITGLSTSHAMRLTRLIAAWASPRPWCDGSVTPEFVAASQGYARIMLGDVTRIYADNWVVLYQSRSIAARLNLPTPTVPGLPGILFPQRATIIDGELNESQSDAVSALATDWSKQGPVPALVREWCRVDDEACKAGAYPNLSGQLGTEVARLTDEPMEWLRALLERDAPVHLIAPFADRCGRDSAAYREKFAGHYLGHAQYGCLALSYLVKFLPAEAGPWAEHGRTIEKHKAVLGISVLRGEVPEENLLALLTRYGGEVAAEVASNLWSARPEGEIPVGLNAAWRAAVIDHVDHAHELEAIAQRYPDIALAWVKRRFNPTKEEQYSENDFEMRAHLRNMVSMLTTEQRRELIALFSSDNYDAELLARLIGDDSDLLRLALSRKETRKRTTACLGLPGAVATVWVERAIIFLEAGFTEDEVLWASGLIGGSWSGPESHYLEDKRKLFCPLLAETDERIRCIGKKAIAHLTKARDAARQSERIAAVKGRLA